MEEKKEINESENNGDDVEIIEDPIEIEFLEDNVKNDKNKKKEEKKLSKRKK